MTVFIRTVLNDQKIMISHDHTTLGSKVINHKINYSSQDEITLPYPSSSSYKTTSTFAPKQLVEWNISTIKDGICQMFIFLQSRISQLSQFCYSLQFILQIVKPNNSLRVHFSLFASEKLTVISNKLDKKFTFLSWIFLINTLHA